MAIFNIVTLYWQLAQSSVCHRFVNTAQSPKLSLYGPLVTSLISVCCLVFLSHVICSLFLFVYILSLFLVRHKFFVWHCKVSFSVRSFSQGFLFNFHANPYLLYWRRLFWPVKQFVDFARRNQFSDSVRGTSFRIL